MDKDMLDTLVPHPSSITVRTVMYAAYVIHHIATGKMYIGSSATPAQRIGFHKTNLKGGRHHNIAFQTAYNESSELRDVIYGVETREKAFALEQALLDHYMPTGNLFNASLDVKSPMKGRPHTEENKALVSRKLTGLVKSAVTRGRLSAALKGRSRSPELMAKLHDTQRKAVVAFGHQYTDAKECAVALGISKATVRRRISDKINFPDWHYA